MFRRSESAHREQYTSVLDSLDLSDGRKDVLRAEWLDEVVCLEAKAEANKRAHYGLRMAAIVGGATLTALAGLQASGAVQSSVSWIIFALGLITTIALALEAFYHYGTTWHTHRTAAEQLKLEGYLFLALVGPYKDCRNHGEAYEDFLARIESITPLSPPFERWFSSMSA